MPKKLNNADQLQPKIAQSVLAEVEIEVNNFVATCLDVAEDCCESPIEVAFLASFLANNESAAPFKMQRFQTVVHLDSADDMDAISNKQVAEDAPYGQMKFFHFIQPQAHIGKFRVDFLVKSVFCQNQEQSRVVHSRTVVVECDGHDFHERTADQASKDKSRDRVLTAKGYTVLRYTGREIWRDPSAAVNEITELLRNDIISIIKGSRHA